MRLPSSFAVIGLLLSSPALNANPLQKEPSERAQREASNPMRVIMEAAQLKRGTRTPESAPSPPLAPTLRPKRTASPATTVTVITAPAKSRPPPPPVTAIAPEEDVLSAPPAPIEVAASSAKTPELSASAVPPHPTAAASGVTPSTPLRLVYRTDPVLPENLQREIPQDTEVLVKLDIDPRGAVYRVEVLSKVIVGLEPLIQSALRRWRFEPMVDRATAQVTLVFRTEE